MTHDIDAPTELSEMAPRSRAQHLAAYAREVVRGYLHVAGDPNEGQSTTAWQGIVVNSNQVAKQFRKNNADLFEEDALSSRAERRALLDQWLLQPPEEFDVLAELSARFKLTPDDIELFIMAAAPAVDPSIYELYRYLWNDVNVRCANVGFVCRLLAVGDPERFEALVARMRFDQPLRLHRLLTLEDRRTNDDTFDKNLLQRRVRAADRVLDFIYTFTQDRADVPTVDESLASICTRHHEQTEITSLSLSEVSTEALKQIARTRKLPAVFEGPAGAGKERTALALASALHRGLLSADLNALIALPVDVLEVRLAELSREARLGNDLLYLQGADLPERVSGPCKRVLERSLESTRQFVLGVDQMPLWLIGLTVGWPVINLSLPSYEGRLDLWREAFEGDRREPPEAALKVIARRYEMSSIQIHQAANEARRLAQVTRSKQIDIGQIDRACRTHFAHQLSDLADLVPPSGFKSSDLILPDNEREKFEEILLYADERETIYTDWGFREKFPYGRGLSVLFYGPPGTGKTMGASIIAATLGLDLFRIDLSRITSRYVGETEKNLARVFDEAEKGRVMLLFDEADSLFTKRTEVKSSVDRYANLEVAYLLQRMENFEGVTVLTTNVEHHLDDAFKRRIRFRIYFPMPDAPTRTRLWEALLPSAAPIAENIPFDLLGEFFELTGGHIKQGVLRAAFYARREGTHIGLHHLVDGGLTECRELGMLVRSELPKKLQRALKIARGEGLAASRSKTPPAPDAVADDASARAAGPTG